MIDWTPKYSLLGALNNWRMFHEKKFWEGRGQHHYVQNNYAFFKIDLIYNLD